MCEQVAYLSWLGQTRRCGGVRDRDGRRLDPNEFFEDYGDDANVDLVATT
jgi:hypothetical protein